MNRSRERVLGPALHERLDSVFSARAIFIDSGSLANASINVRRRLRTLAQFFRIVAVLKKGESPPADKRVLHAPILIEELSKFALRNGLELYSSWFIGNVADVGFKGVLPISAGGGLECAVEKIQVSESTSRIIIDCARLERLIASLKGKGARIVFTNGVFDLVHVGHLRLLERAKLLGDVLIVGINSDDSTKRIKGELRPVVPQFARAETLIDLRSVDYCCIFTETDPKRTLAIVRPDVLAKGRDYSFRRVVGGRYVSGYGGTVARLALVDGCSTTATINRIHTKKKEKAGRHRGAGLE
jgi:D-beta-D-heptose 7-phosphate kinase/D-beta-D-heptose 1-phosphate adenosyltransferase